MSTNRDHESGQPTGNVWEGYKTLDAYRFGRQDTIREANEVLKAKGPEGLAEWVRRLAG